MGCDPVPDHFPAELQAMGPAAIPVFFEILFREMAHRKLRPAAFKPNQGYYIIHDRPMDGQFEGSLAMVRTLKLIRSYFPDVPVILDFKRGDIARSSHNYAVEGYELWEADAVTVSPYMGEDSVLPFVRFAEKGKGCYILNRTSNAGAADFQSRDMKESEPLFMRVARRIIDWNRDYPGTGAVVGATSTAELESVAALYAEYAIPLLIPGVGSQGGSAEEVCTVLKGLSYPLHQVRINSSSGLTHPWAAQKQSAPEHWAEMAVDQIEKLISQTAAFL